MGKKVREGKGREGRGVMNQGEKRWEETYDYVFYGLLSCVSDKNSGLKGMSVSLGKRIKWKVRFLFRSHPHFLEIFNEGNRQNNDDF